MYNDTCGAREMLSRNGISEVISSDLESEDQ